MRLANLRASFGSNLSLASRCRPPTHASRQQMQDLAQTALPIGIELAGGGTTTFTAHYTRYLTHFGVSGLEPLADLVMRGDELRHPVNYSLLRIIPPDSAEIESPRRWLPRSRRMFRNRTDHCQKSRTYSLRAVGASLPIWSVNSSSALGGVRTSSGILPVIAWPTASSF
jgi:hypothetical protein